MKVHKYRSEYWSNSKFADKIRGSKKPKVATAEGWDDWKNKAKKTSRWRYWVAEEGLDILQDVVNWPSDILYALKYYVINRWIDQSHALVAHKKHIKRGEWSDLDHRILYALFDELVDFVEIEKAYSNYRWQEEKVKTLKWWQGGKWRTRTWRSAEAGIDHLKWEMSLTMDKDYTNNPEKIGQPTSQALAAKEIYELYTWWTKVYPNRPDAYDISGWSEYCRKREENGIGFLHKDPNEDPKETRSILDRNREIEQQYEDEDTEMLIRLIKVRKFLWA